MERVIGLRGSANKKMLDDAVALVEPLISELGCELVDMEYVASRGRWILRLYIDKEDGVTIDDCAAVSREIGDALDVKEVIGHNYVLEVSSPGLNRPLTRKKDFEMAIGKRIKLRTIEPIDGSRNITGILKELGEGLLTLKVERGFVTIPVGSIEKANLIYDFTKI
jgi:ribosome maturation factor RimP